MNSTAILGGRTDLGEDLLGPVDVIVGQHQLLHPGLVLGDDGDGLADAAYTYQQDLHLDTVPFLGSTLNAAMASPTAIAKKMPAITSMAVNMLSKLSKKP